MKIGEIWKRKFNHQIGGLYIKIIGKGQNDSWLIIWKHRDGDSWWAGLPVDYSRQFIVDNYALVRI